MYMYMYMCMYVNIYIYMCVCVCVCVCVCIYSGIQRVVRWPLYTCTYVSMYVCMYVGWYVCAGISKPASVLVICMNEKKQKKTEVLCDIFVSRTYQVHSGKNSVISVRLIPSAHADADIIDATRKLEAPPPRPMIRHAAHASWSLSGVRNRNRNRNRNRRITDSDFSALSDDHSHTALSLPTYFFPIKPNCTC